MSDHIEIPSMDTLNKKFILDAENGILIHKKKFGIAAGNPAGNVMPQGYRRIKISGKLYLSHRIIYKMYYGADPGIKEVDHINGDKKDSRPVNLRLATREQNRQNAGVYLSNSLKTRGVWFDPRRSAYFCAVQANKVRERFGPFNTINKAVSVYQKEAKERFGEFYRGSAL